MTGRSNAVHKADVKVGSTYAVKVSGRIVPVTIDSIRKVNTGYPVSREVTQWSGLNRQTGKQVTIRSAAKLRYELIWSGPVDLNTKQGGRWVRKDSPVVFERVDPPADVLAAVAFMTIGWNPREADFQMAEFLHVADDPIETRIATIADYCWDHLMGEPSKPTLAQVEKAIRENLRRDVTPDELHDLCGEDAPEQCQEFEDESGRWHRV